MTALGLGLLLELMLELGLGIGVGANTRTWTEAETATETGRKTWVGTGTGWGLGLWLEPGLGPMRITLCVLKYDTSPSHEYLESLGFHFLLLRQLFVHHDLYDTT